MVQVALRESQAHDQIGDGDDLPRAVEDECRSLVALTVVVVRAPDDDVVPSVAVDIAGAGDRAAEQRTVLVGA